MQCQGDAHISLPAESLKHRDDTKFLSVTMLTFDMSVYIISNSQKSLTFYQFCFLVF